MIRTAALALLLVLPIACNSTGGTAPGPRTGPGNTRAPIQGTKAPDPGPPRERADGPKLLFTTDGHHYGPMEKHTKRTFTAIFYNAGDEDLEIRKINTHCGCAAALLSAKEISPGGRGTMKITMDSGGLPGRRAKTVEVFTNDPVTPVTKFPIACDVIADCGLDPIVLVLRATRTTGDVATSFNVVSLRPEFDLKIVKIDTGKPGLTATHTPLPAGSGKTGYRIDLEFGASFGSGDFKERVTVHTNSKRDPRLYMDIFGSVREAILVVPERLYFPPLKPGEVVNRLVYVYREDGKPLTVTGVEDPSGMFESSIRRMQPDRWEVKLSISGEVPIQTVRGSVIIKTDEAEEPTVAVPYEIPGEHQLMHGRIALALLTLLALTLLALTVLGLAACEPKPDPSPPQNSGGPMSRASLFVGGEERGYLEPCGCTRPQLGGLARKATALGGAPLLENGDLVDRPGRLQELKFESFLLALSEIGCRALNLGEGDLKLGIPFLKSSAGLAGFPLISANVLDGTGRPAFPGHADFTHDGRQIRAVGLLDPALAGGTKVEDPGRALDREMAAVDPAKVRVILLFHGPMEKARRLIDAHPGIELGVCAHGNGEPHVHGDRLVDPGDRSRWIVQLSGPPRVIELGESFANDPRMDRALRTYVRRLGEEDLLHRMNPLAKPEGGGYAGDRACAECHAEATRVHESSLHAKAIQVLEKTGREIDPDCVSCHVVGYGEKTGFLSVKETPALARVGCENCHGPASAHAKDPKRIRPGRDCRTSCVTCHTADTDPHFAFEKKWPKIKHE